MQVITDHPAKFSKPVLEQIQEIIHMEDRRLLHPLHIFDPFAGTGLVHGLASECGVHSWGVEIEPEWAACHERTIVGNALRLPFATDSMDGLVTSPCYGNRMADHHQASDLCSKCKGRGWFLELERPCPTCKGVGMSRRNTYTHRLQAALRDPSRQLHPENSGTVPWGKRYRHFHELAYREAARCIRPGGFAVVNISNHLETSNGVTVEHRVAEWTMNQWLLMGVHLAGAWPVVTSRNGEGANRDARTAFELVYLFHLPDTQPTLF